MSSDTHFPDGVIGSLDIYLRVKVACALRSLRVNRESSEKLELTRSGKDRRDERDMQTLLLAAGSLHPLNATKPEDLPGHVAMGATIAYYRSRQRHPYSFADA